MAAVSTLRPWKNGSNMDINEMQEGSTVFIPVFIKGAFLWTGDSHCRQGNGEVNLTARLQTAADADCILLSFETYVLVRDVVDAEEREPILAKGIRREVRPFAVRSIFANEEEPDQVLRVDGGYTAQ